MFTYKFRSWMFASAITVNPCWVSAGPDLGEKATPNKVAAADISIPPDGTNLPAGGGTSAVGELIYQSNCLRCHGIDAVSGEGLADPLAGGIGSLASAAPKKTVGSYWPYATTLFDYIRRAMPLDAPMTLTDNEAYAVSAYILQLNGIIELDAIMNAETLPKVIMPNRDGFKRISK